MSRPFSIFYNALTVSEYRFIHWLTCKKKIYTTTRTSGYMFLFLADTINRIYSSFALLTKILGLL